MPPRHGAPRRAALLCAAACARWGVPPPAAAAPALPVLRQLPTVHRVLRDVPVLRGWQGTPVPPQPPPPMRRPEDVQRGTEGVDGPEDTQPSPADEDQCQGCDGARRLVHLHRCVHCGKMKVLGFGVLVLLFFCCGVAFVKVRESFEQLRPRTYAGVPVADPADGTGGEARRAPSGRPPSDAGSASVAAAGGYGVCAVAAAAPLGVVWGVLIAAQQIAALPLRVADAALDAVAGRRRRLLTALLRFCAPLLMPLMTLLSVCGMGEACWGATGLAGHADAESWYATRSRSRQKCVRRNLKKASSTLAAAGITAERKGRGTWGIGAEHLRVVLAHCRKKAGAERARFAGGCRIPPAVFALGEVALLVSLPLDVQEFRRGDGELVAFNTRLVVGRASFNPNYACRPEWSRAGVYWEAARDLLSYSAERGAEAFNMMPSMAEAKTALGLHPLPLASALLCWKCGCCRRGGAAPKKRLTRSQRKQLQRAGAASPRSTATPGLTHSGPRSPQPAAGI